MPACRGAAWEKGISHTQRVTRLYRGSLRTAKDWIIDYDQWVTECINIQSRFRANKTKSLVEGKHLVEEGMAELLSKRHPEPYIPNYARDGSKYQRNVPPPPEVCPSSSIHSSSSSFPPVLLFLTKHIARKFISSKF